MGQPPSQVVALCTGVSSLSCLFPGSHDPCGLALSSMNTMNTPLPEKYRWAGSFWYTIFFFGKIHGTTHAVEYLESGQAGIFMTRGYRSCAHSLEIRCRYAFDASL